ncbi:hypothetical protein HK097_010484 [Rhizophlyctis rosea]|uniref:L-type lectin-like domain-containing protein n=1 Tax=Rhizophlyctis rosea TaxID=64517 RepID=A0AAD5SA72_9FUNG|nr:hypothetical protein HK097_010484 [Rhizophlyctis rosea]
MIGDGKTKYDHSNDGIPQQIGGCPSDFRGKEHATVAKVKYVQNQMLQIQLSVRGDDSWEDCFIAENVTLPTLGYLGFSAWTGDVHDNHDIIRVTTHGITNPHVEHAKQGNQSGGSGASSSGWGVWFFVFVLVGLGAVVGGVFLSRKAQERSYKRF